MGRRDTGYRRNQNCIGEPGSERADAHCDEGLAYSPDTPAGVQFVDMAEASQTFLPA